MIYSIKQINEINDIVEKDETVNQHKKLELLKGALDSLGILNDEVLTSRTYVNYCIGLYNIGEIDEAKKIALRMYQFTKKKDIHEAHMKCCNFLGNMSSVESHYALAIDYYHQALRVIDLHLQKLNNKSSIINNIGAIYANLKMMEMAEKLYLEALELSYIEHNPKSTFLIAYNLADIYNEGKAPEKAKYYLEISENLLKEKKFSASYQGILKLQRAKYFRNINELDLAMEWCQKALTLVQEDGDKIGIAETQLELSHIYKDNKDYDDALKHAFNAYNAALEIKEHDFMRACLLVICDVLGKTKQVEKLLVYYKDLIELDEILFKSLHEMSIYQIQEKSNVELEENRSVYTEKLLNNMRFIHEVSQDISKELDYESLIALVIEKLIGFVNFDSLVIGLHDEDNNEIYKRIVYHRGEITKSFNVDVANKSSLAAWCIRHEKEIYTGVCSHLNLEDFEPLKQNFPELDVPYETVFYIPLFNEKRIIGVFSLQKFEREGFDHYELEMIRAISSYIAVAIINALKSEKMKALNYKLEQVSRRDGLSGLYNRNALNVDLVEIIEALKLGDELTVIMCDIDYFKEYNDTYGHIDGDQVIRTVSNEILRHTLPVTQYAYRYGGDEFLVILPGLASIDAQQVGSNILEGVSEHQIPHDKVGIDNIVTISVGIATFKLENRVISEDILLKNADFALYEAKRRGRNQYKITEFKI